MSRSTWSRTAATLAAVALATTACGTTAGNDDEDTAAAGPISGLRVMVPNSPGSGYDPIAANPVVRLVA